MLQLKERHDLKVSCLAAGTKDILFRELKASWRRRRRKRRICCMRHELRRGFVEVARWVGEV